MTAVPMLHKPKKERGLKQGVLFEDGYEHWGWWCPVCSLDKPFTIQQTGFTTREGARKAAHKHEKRRGH